MSASENKQTVEKIFAALSRGDGEGYLAGLADDVEFKIEGTTKFSGTFHGKQQVIERLLQPLMAELEGGLAIAVDHIYADGDTVIVQAHGRSKTKRGGTYNNSYCQIFRVAGGKVKSIVEYLDTALVDQAFGK
jgi:ketosteroid isomerase-like protein